MARSGNRGVLIALAVFVALAALIRVFGEPLFDLFISMHGGGGGGH
jgi:hypothetical protein